MVDEGRGAIKREENGELVVMSARKSSRDAENTVEYDKLVLLTVRKQDG